MSIKEKVISVSAAAILTVVLTGPSLAAVIPFTDLGEISAQEEILSLQERGYVHGVGNDLFAPAKTIEAGEGIQLIVNALGLNLDSIRFIKEPKATDYFSKANNDAWYAKALIVASVNGLELPADLDPGRKWTREEFTYQLVKGIEKQGNLPLLNLIPVEIADGEQLNILYSGAIQRALVYGIISLDSEEKLNPRAEVTRAEAAEQIYDALEYLKTHSAPAVNPESKTVEE
ncbi:MAG: S-layer homology domain-containing protein [Peptococcaceae bacterium]